MREIETHKINGLNEAITLTVIDEPGDGGACHHYRQSYRREARGNEAQDIWFQQGPIQEVGVNGTSNEALLAIVLDRLECFQAGPYACEENELARLSVVAALEALLRRTRARLARGVEGMSMV